MNLRLTNWERKGKDIIIVNTQNPGLFYQTRIF